ncbi:hypothetical protein JVX90_00250 [Gordonia sp. PDNC005]|uniref:hypothetical protein n=1 Tax=Gordonia sp. PDNC005 TaxID=2811424 RepID=UPI0019647F6D|nr:hypothetical protein [Gordonia sp. PDNC005]QRY62743.1 hypothetical protein JVX90_00250 [Gordonia sp. PDNC005]
MTTTEQVTARDVLLACDIAVRLTLEAAAKMVRNHRGRGERGRYVGIDDADLYLVLDPPATAAEMDRFVAKFTDWWHLPSVLDDSAVPNMRLYMGACQEYVRALMLSQTRHDPTVLHTYLAQADAVAASR